MVDTETIKNELHNVGIKVDSIWDLVNTRERYPEAIPVLVNLVQQDFSDNRDKEGVIRALTVKEAKGIANQALMAEYKKIPKDHLASFPEHIVAIIEKIGVETPEESAELTHFYKERRERNIVSYGWVIGNAFSVIITKEDVDEILSIVRDKGNGTSRQMFVYALGKIKSGSSQTEDVLISLLDDKDVIGHALYALGRLKSQKAKAKIETFLNHPKLYYRREAKAALKRIG